MFGVSLGLSAATSVPRSPPHPLLGAAPGHVRSPQELAQPLHAASPAPRQGTREVRRSRDGKTKASFGMHGATRSSSSTCPHHGLPRNLVPPVPPCPPWQGAGCPVPPAGAVPGGQSLTVRARGQGAKSPAADQPRDVIEGDRAVGAVWGEGSWGVVALTQILLGWGGTRSTPLCPVPWAVPNPDPPGTRRAGRRC